MLSIHCKTSLYTSLSKSLSNSDSSSSSKYSNTYYLSLNEHWKTSEHAQLVTKQAKEHTRRQLKLLEKSFKLEKQKITEKVLIAHGDATTVEFNNYLDEAPPVNPQKSHAVSQPKTRSGIDSAVRSCHQATSNHQNCWANSLLSHSSCPSISSTSFSETSNNKPFLIQNRSSKFIKPPIDKDIKHSIDQPSMHELVSKSVTVHYHNPLFTNRQQHPQLLETQNAPGTLSVVNPTPYSSHNKNLPAHLKNKILNISKNFKIREPVNQFINNLIEGFETKLLESHVNVNICLVLKQGYGCW